MSKHSSLKATGTVGGKRSVLKRFEPVSYTHLWEIDAPKNLWKSANAQRLLGCYNVVDYPTMTKDDVWNYIGAVSYTHLP